MLKKFWEEKVAKPKILEVVNHGVGELEMGIGGVVESNNSYNSHVALRKSYKIIGQNCMTDQNRKDPQTSLA